jgi:hypothetical protein
VRIGYSGLRPRSFASHVWEWLIDFVSNLQPQTQALFLAALFLAVFLTAPVILRYLYSTVSTP